MGTNVTATDAAPPRDPQAIKDYHAHIYYDPSTREQAARLREQVAAAFPSATLRTLARCPRRPAPAVDVSDSLSDRIAGLIHTLADAQSCWPDCPASPRDGKRLRRPHRPRGLAWRNPSPSARCSEWLSNGFPS
jgi:hypothetical protein